jgi:hypothetical protein
VLHERVSEAHDAGAFVLGFDLTRIEGLTHVARDNALNELNGTGFGVDFQLNCYGVELPERGMSAERMSFDRIVAIAAEADDFTAGGEGDLQGLVELQGTAGDLYLPILKDDIIGRDV